MDAALLAALRVIPDTFGFPRGGYPPASDLLCCEFYHTGVLFLRYVGVRVMKTGTVSSGTITCFPTRWRCFGETSNLVLSIDEKRMFIRQRYSPDLSHVQILRMLTIISLLFISSLSLCLVLRDEISCVCAKNWRNPDIYCESPMPLFVTYPNMHVTSFFPMSCVFTRIKSFNMNDATLKDVSAKKNCAPRLAESI